MSRVAGSLMLQEIREQPAALERVVEHEEELRAVADWLRQAPPRLVRLVAHGTSDNAATYGVYAFGLLAGLTAFRDSISLTTYYEADIAIADDLVVALSQSGETPDVVAYVERARECGARTVAITNDVDSALASRADAVLPLHAGPEQAVAATKTYTTSLASLALLAAALGGRRGMADAVRRTAELLTAALDELEHAVVPVAASCAYVGRMFVVGRGVELATAREIALKLQETCRIAADALSATDLAHGPVAAVDPLFPVWAVAGDDPTLPGVVESARRTRDSGGTLIASGPAAAAIEGAVHRLATPPAPDPLLSPLLSVVPGQMFAHALAVAKGYDPDAPHGLSKITRVP